MSGRMGAAGAVALLSLMVGCSGQDPPASTPDPTIASSPTSSAPPPSTPAPTTEPDGPPPLPEAATQQTPDGAEAFVRHWYETLGYSQRILESQPIRSISDPECLTCNNFADTIDIVQNEGNHLEGGDIIVTNAEPSLVNSQGKATVLSLISFAEQRIVGPDGAPLTAGPPEPNVQFLVTVVWTDSGWIARDIQLLA